MIAELGLAALWMAATLAFLQLMLAWFGLIGGKDEFRDHGLGVPST
jgi:cytochrome c-type biogenesis protein CcmF